LPFEAFDGGLILLPFDACRPAEYRLENARSSGLSRGSETGAGRGQQARQEKTILNAVDRC
jgi:hypothetical protein